MATLWIPYHLDERLADLGVEVGDRDELVVDLPEGELWDRLGRLYDEVAKMTEREVRAGSVPTVVSGDCTVSLGMTAGMQRAGVDPAIVWIDAHGDLQTLETTASGYVGGMALRFLLGYRPELYTEGLGLRPVDQDRVLLVDARDLDQPEADYLAGSKVRRATVAGLSAEDLPAGPLLVNLDLDVTDPEQLPGIRFPAPGGPDLPAVLGAARTLLDTGRVAALNIACTWDASTPDPGGVRSRVVADVLHG